MLSSQFIQWNSRYITTDLFTELVNVNIKYKNERFSTILYKNTNYRDSAYIPICKNKKMFRKSNCNNFTIQFNKEQK